MNSFIDCMYFGFLLLLKSAKGHLFLVIDDTLQFSTIHAVTI